MSKIILITCIKMCFDFHINMLQKCLLTSNTFSHTTNTSVLLLKTLSIVYTIDFPRTHSLTKQSICLVTLSLITLRILCSRKHSYFVYISVLSDTHFHTKSVYLKHILTSGTCTHCTVFFRILCLQMCFKETQFIFFKQGSLHILLKNAYNKNTWKIPKV